MLSDAVVIGALKIKSKFLVFIPRWYFSYFYKTKYLVGTWWGTSNKYPQCTFHGEIRKISIFLTEKSAVSDAMLSTWRNRWKSLIWVFYGGMSSLSVHLSLHWVYMTKGTVSTVTAFGHYSLSKLPTKQHYFCFFKKKAFSISFKGIGYTRQIFFFFFFLPFFTRETTLVILWFAQWTLLRSEPISLPNHTFPAQP